MIKLCQKHFNELLERWGSTNAIKRAYENYEIVDKKECENLECIKARGQHIGEW